MIKLKIWFFIWVLKNFYGYFNISVKVFFSQIVHETANFTSVVYKENNNLFGMRQAKIRKNKAIGTNKNHAIYKNHFESIVDYFLRQKYFRVTGNNDIAYMKNTVMSNYAEDKNYYIKWRNWYDKTTTPIISKLIVYGGLFFLAITLIIYFKKQKYV